MPPKLFHATLLCIAAAATTVLLVGVNNATSTPALAQPAAAAPARWHVVNIERTGSVEHARVMRDAVLVDGETGQTWIMTNQEGAHPSWVVVTRK